MLFLHNHYLKESGHSGGKTRIFSTPQFLLTGLEVASEWVGGSYSPEAIQSGMSHGQGLVPRPSKCTNKF